MRRVDRAKSAGLWNQCGASVLELYDAVVTSDARTSKDDVGMRSRDVVFITTDGGFAFFQVVQRDPGAQDIFVDANLKGKRKPCRDYSEDSVIRLDQYTKSYSS